ncbi:MAG: hypothetical protein M3P49_15965, partial [Actinomycetota bacterium]|nr:hypothetical protein [Actinomycetota bacterium]
PGDGAGGGEGLPAVSEGHTASGVRSCYGCTHLRYRGPQSITNVRDMMGGTAIPLREQDGFLGPGRYECSKLGKTIMRADGDRRGVQGSQVEGKKKTLAASARRRTSAPEVFSELRAEGVLGSSSWKARLWLTRNGCLAYRWVPPPTPYSQRTHTKKQPPFRGGGAKPVGFAGG